MLAHPPAQRMPRALCSILVLVWMPRAASTISYAETLGKTTWQAAEADCISQGGHLATANSQAALDAIVAAKTVGLVWIGGRDFNGQPASNPQWTWADGTSFPPTPNPDSSFAPWCSLGQGSFEPNKDNEPCMVLDNTCFRNWRCDRASADWGYVCEFSPSTPSPAPPPSPPPPTPSPPPPVPRAVLQPRQCVTTADGVSRCIQIQEGLSLDDERVQAMMERRFASRSPSQPQPSPSVE